MRNIFSAIDSQDLVTIAWANLPRELYNVKIRQGVVFKGLGFCVLGLQLCFYKQRFGDEGSRCKVSGVVFWVEVFRV